MENFNYQCTTKIIFGKDTENKVGKELKGYKVLLHYGGGSIKKTGLYDKIINSLNENKIEFVELSGVVPNPRIGLVRKGVELCRRENIDFILAVGGGSVIDSAKAIAAGFYYEGDAWDLFTGTEIKKMLPVGVVLTIPAAGSESSTASVITNDETKQKYHFGSELARPQFAIMNPELTKTLPDYQTACGVADMMAHIFERYFTNTKHVDLTDELCEATLRSIIKNARLVLSEPGNYDYRAEIMLAGKIAHDDSLGIGREEDWASHTIEHQLSAYYDIAHGAGLAIIFPSWMNQVYKHDVKRFARFARNVWGVQELDEDICALLGIEATKSFFSKLGLPTSLKEVKIGEEKIEIMAKNCTPVGCFVNLQYEDVIEIYRRAV